MEYRRLGQTGLQVSQICLGMMSYGSPDWRDWVLPEDEARPMVQHAASAGINFFDTADMYSIGVSETITGKLLKEIFSSRDEYVVATKVFFEMGDRPNQRGLSRKHIMDAVDASLRRLDLDYIDLYQIHRWDYDTPIEETMEALNDVVRVGKVRYIGASSMWTWQFMKAQSVAERHGWTRFVSMQNHYNLIYREEEREMIPCCVDQGVGLIPWSPLARGFLAGTRTRDKGGQSARSRSDVHAHSMYYSDSDWAVEAAVRQVAQAHGVSMAQVALAWMLHKPAITSPIIGATRMQHLDEALRAVDLVLSAEDIAALEAPYQPRYVLGHA